MNEICHNCKFWKEEGAYLPPDGSEPEFLAIVGFCAARSAHTEENYSCEMYEERED